MPAGDPIYASDFDRPVVRLIAQSAQNVADSTTTAIQFGSGSEDIDPNGWHDTVTNNTRITPTKAGIYEVVGTLWIGMLTTQAQIFAAIAKNGTSVQIIRSKPDLANTSAVGIQVNTLVQINGTGDYVELNAFQDNTANSTVGTTTGIGTASTLELRYYSPL